MKSFPIHKTSLLASALPALPAAYGATMAKTDADYKVAAEKCEALAGDAKSSCMASAKAKFGKT